MGSLLTSGLLDSTPASSSDAGPSFDMRFTTEEQLEREGTTANFDSMLERAIFAGSNLAHVGRVTPYSVVFGRQPSMLPPLEADEQG